MRVYRSICLMRQVCLLHGCPSGVVVHYSAEVDERWPTRVREPAIDITERLLDQTPLPEPRSLSPLADKLLNVTPKSAKWVSQFVWCSRANCLLRP